MKWLKALFSTRRAGGSGAVSAANSAGEGSSDASWANLVQGDERVFEAAARVLIDHSCDLKRCKDELSSLGLNPTAMVRLSALLPVACGRKIFARAAKPPKYSPFYIVTNFGRSRVEVPYATCPVYLGIERALTTTSAAQIAAIGALACETQSINDCLNQLKADGKPLDLSVITVYPTEVKC